jgi:VIT1/CCC1 family predicted Fe2+/Mn2+ transporter
LPNGKSYDRIMSVASIGRHVGMADEADSKSVDGNIVWVQVPLPALHPWQGTRPWKPESLQISRAFSLFCSVLFPVISYIFLNSGKITGTSAIFVIYCKKIRKNEGR